ncbi:hypothetical protein NXS19_008379 [Fusarium pseudograminearum]|nr:hypothetical protein FPSE5266_20129 [Fusarium pseudograminearum]UZP40563.1 hypothetical protein NXS19_008379 [Fusarium pseudograminearum]
MTIYFPAIELAYQNKFILSLSGNSKRYRLNIATMAPKRKVKGRAVHAQAHSAVDDTQAENTKVLAKWHHNFQSIKRIFDANKQHPDLTWPEWFDTNNDYSITSHPNPPIPNNQAGKKAKEHEKFGYPDGVLVNFLFKSTMGASNELAPHLAFKGVLEMNSYIDIIDADIIHQSALLVSEGFVLSDKHSNKRGDNTIVTMV